MAFSHGFSSPTGGQLVDLVLGQDQLSSELVAVLPGALSDGLVSGLLSHGGHGSNIFGRLS